MLAKSEKEFIALFNTIEEPREAGRTLYPIEEIIFLVIMAVLSCAESWSEIVKYGRIHIKFLRQYFPFIHGIPSKSVLSRVFGMLDKEKMADFLLRLNALFNAEGEIIAMDGKRLRGSDIHLLHVYATQQGIVLAQKYIENKVNESPAIPEILEDLAIKGAVVTADALNCQKAIAEKIREKDADYFLAVKGNQGTLFDDVKTYFEKKSLYDFYEEADKGHGRIECRKCYSTSDIEWLKAMHPDWKDLKSICMIASERVIKNKVEKQKRYYISSTAALAQKHLKYSREHWQIENNLHGVLDVIFREDQATLAQRAAHNVAVIRKLILNMIKRYKTATGEKIAIKSVRKMACWSTNVAADIIKYWVVN